MAVKKPKKNSLFKKGQSGNPKGRPVGSRNKATIAIETLLDGDAEKLTQKAIELALEGDGPMMRLCLERICPPRKDSPIKFTLPQVDSLRDHPKALEAILQAVSSGEVTPHEGQTVMAMLELHRRALETSDLTKRLEILEGHHDQLKK